MKLKLFLKALFHFRNIGMLLIMSGIGVAVTQSLDFSPLYTAGGVASIYLGFVLQSFTSKSFQDRFLHKIKEKRIKELNKMCIHLALGTKKYTNAAYYKKLCSIMEDREEVVKSYFKDKSNYLNQKITEQTLNLVVSYIKLLKDFCIRCRETSQTNLSPVVERISKNTRKLSFTNDPKVYEDLKRIIEMDERMIQRLKEERSDLERVDARLDCIKSTVSMLKHQINTGLDSEETLENIESALNEAVALENVLEERNKRRLRN